MFEGWGRHLKLFSLLVLLMLILSMVGTSSVYALDKHWPSAMDLAVLSPPNPVEPAGTYWTNDLTYKWTIILGATDYQYRVWDGASKMWDQTVSSSACDATYCTDHPTELHLIDGTYKWTVRAKAGGVWTDWSSLQWYSIKAGFNSQFTSDAAGWQPTYGAWTWDIFEGNYRTTGINSLYSTSRFDQVYGVLTYEVKLRRQGLGTGAAYGILFNGNPWPLDILKRWNKGYAFYINKDGNFSIYRLYGGVATAIQPWTNSGGLINTGWYNTLKVTYNKNTGYTQFFINGSQVATYTLTDYKWGNVGITMYKGLTSWEQVLVDWAVLTPSAPSSAAESDVTGGIYIDEASIPPMPGDDTGH